TRGTRAVRRTQGARGTRKGRTGGTGGARGGGSGPSADRGATSGASPLVTFAVLALLLTGTALAGAAALAGYFGGWESAGYVLALIGFLFAAYFALNQIGDLAPKHFLAALLGALATAGCAGAALFLVLDALPDDVTAETALDGNGDGNGGRDGDDGAVLLGHSDTVRLTVRAEPSHGTLRLALAAANKSPGTSCLPRSELKFSGADLARPTSASMNTTMETDLPLATTRAPKVDVDIRLAAGAGCEILLEVKRAEYR
ncbi:hypothetical protein G5C65_36375, partial [Streptomyces sp. SB3404]|nr:hypothetical protein [Streptomyces boncukensis]